MARAHSNYEEADKELHEILERPEDKERNLYMLMALGLPRWKARHLVGMSAEEAKKLAGTKL